MAHLLVMIYMSFFDILISYHKLYIVGKVNKHFITCFSY